MGRKKVLGHAGQEKKTAGGGGGGGGGSGGGSGGPQHFTPGHQAHSAGPAGPDAPTEQSGICLNHSLSPFQCTETQQKQFLFLPQMRNIQRPQIKPTPTPGNTAPTRDTSPKTVWSSRVEGYIILRDLDLYLTKLARDFLLLASKTHVTQQ